MTTAASPVVTPARARAARLGVSAMFFANGAIAASIIPRLPAIKDGLALSNGELGAAVAAMPLGGLLAGGLVGILVGRFGSGRVATVAGTAAGLALVGVGLSGSWLTLAAAYLVLGMFDATMDASMNAHSLGLQRQYGRSILQGFHGIWSLGSMAAGAVGAVAAGAGVPVAVHLGVAALGLAATATLAGRQFLPASVADAHVDDGAAAEHIHPRNAPRLLRVLVPVAMLGILCVMLQSSAATWSSVYLSDVLRQPAGIAATGFVLYMAAMVLGRMTNDRWVDRWGSTAVVRAGALLGTVAVGMVIVAAPLNLAPLALAGFALVGLGSSSMFPVMVLAAGSRPGIPARHGVALVSWMVRVGLIIAPALIGAAADAWGLAAALGFSLAATLVVALVAPALTGGRLRRRPAEAIAA
jgi:MFS family permease